jgi:hypothetical protein
MTPPEFSVLLLAWDDADPSVAVLGGAALPPTLPLVYQLAAQQPVLAVYPHLPAAADIPTPEPLAEAAEAPASPTAAVLAASVGTTEPEVPQGALDTAAAMPGVQLLSTAAEAPVTGQPWHSRIIGLADLVPARPAQPAATLPTMGKALAATPYAASRSQWPTGENAPALAGQWQTPAAPYVGAGAGTVFPPPPPAPPRRNTGQTPLLAPALSAKPAARPAATPSTSKATAALRPRQHPQAGDLRFDPDPELPAVQRPIVFDEPTAEMGAAEANDLSAPEDDLVLDEPVPAAKPASARISAPTPAEPAAPATPAVVMPRLDGLNFRMIQYARQAAQLVRGRADFGVIYAPNWPAWLAALEIRSSSGQPLVLYAASLAIDLPNPAEHGYQLEMERMTMRRARLILVPDEATRQRLRGLYQDTIGEVRVVAADDEATVQRMLSEVAMG